MCLIVDNNITGDLLADPPDAACAKVLDWVTKPLRDGALVYGGRLAREYDGSPRMRKLVLALQKRGRAFLIPSEIVDAEEVRLAEGGSLRSDDGHVVALARVSGTRLVFTRDLALMSDMEDRALVADPPGRVYQTEKHARLLRHSPGCPQARAK